LHLVAGRVDGVSSFAVGRAVAGTAADALVTAGAKCPAAIFFTRTVAGQQHRSDIWGTPCVVKNAVELIDGVRAKSIADLRAVKRNTHDAIGAAFAGVSVVSDVCEVAIPLHCPPHG